MEYMSVRQAASLWNKSERSIRNYCAQGRIPGAVLDGKTWKIPKAAALPERKQRAGNKPENLLTRLKYEKESALAGGIYHKLQIELTYNSNHMEGSKLTREQTRYIFETNTIGIEKEKVHVDDIVETVNHFKCVDLIIELAGYRLSEAFLKQLHLILKTGTSDSRKPWFAVGAYKRLENEVGGKATISPAETAAAVKKLLAAYNLKEKHTLKEIVAFHHDFERIHPFQDGNGRIGRLIMFKECLRNGITPFIISDDMKEYYYRGLQEWQKEPGYLMDTCLAAQDRFKAYMDYFGLRYDD